MKKDLKVGIITFHNSFNCGSMLETYAMFYLVKQLGYDANIINFSSEGQQKLYAVTFQDKNIKSFIKNIIIFPHLNRIKRNNTRYREFQQKYFDLDQKQISDVSRLSDDGYFAVIAGSDQIWNITIPDASDAYFLCWVQKAKKIAYAPSFGAKKIVKYANNPDKYYKLISDFDYLSIREFNGQKWLKEMVNIDVPVVLDPTLLLSKEEYLPLVANDINIKNKYIFFYCPGFDSAICKFVQKVARKYNLEVIVWSCKQYYSKFIKRFGFKLADYENPSSYLFYIKNAQLVFTTSFHGTIFSTIFKKKFYTLKNGGMYGDDDRVTSLVKQLQIEDRLIPYEFVDDFDYLKEVNYKIYEQALSKLQEKSLLYLKESLDRKEK